MLLAELVETSRRVADTRSRKRKIVELTSCLTKLARDEIGIAVPYLSGSLRQGRIGLGYATVYKTEAAAASMATLTLGDVDQALSQVAATSGKGSVRERERILGALLSRATDDEQQLLRGLLVGELRQGALAGILIDAVAVACGVDVAKLRRAAMLSGDLAAVSVAAMQRGESALAAFQLTVFTPLVPMLAQTCDDAADAIARFDRAVLDYKIDGARVQVHKSGDEVRVFTRNLKDVTRALPEVVELTQALDAREIVLDGEVIALDPRGRPHPFQTTMRRFGRKLDVAGLRTELPLSTFFFDCLYVDGDALIDSDTERRADAMTSLLPAHAITPRIVSADAAEAEAFLDAALEAGHEGIMAKALGAPYAAGSRGAEWLKIKPTHTLDLVVLAAEWGHGRRQGWLSNLHLGARNADGSFTMLGKTFKGMTDEVLRWQTKALEARAIAREGHVVHVRPELVVEIALNDVQQSPHYPGGLALRFARLKRYRPDKSAADADTLETVRAIHDGSSQKRR